MTEVIASTFKLRSPDVFIGVQVLRELVAGTDVLPNENSTQGRAATTRAFNAMAKQLAIDVRRKRELGARATRIAHIPDLSGRPYPVTELNLTATVRDYRPRMCDESFLPAGARAIWTTAFETLDAIGTIATEDVEAQTEPNDLIIEAEQ